MMEFNEDNLHDHQQRDLYNWNALLIRWLRFAVQTLLSVGELHIVHVLSSNIFMCMYNSIVYIKYNFRV